MNCSSTTKHILAPLVTAVLLGQAPAASALEYTARLLKPYGAPGYTGWGISSNSQVGEVSQSKIQFAALWVNGIDDPVILLPKEFTYSSATGVDGNVQVGYGASSATGGQPHALMWNGTSDNYVDLHPSGFVASRALAVSGPSQAGIVWNEGDVLDPHAALWKGSADSFVDLHIEGWEGSQALGVSGNRQIGWVGGPGSHAMLWNGAPESYVDLNPLGFSHTWGTGIDGDTQVGYGGGAATDSTVHALKWNSTPESVVDLHPAGFEFSETTAVAGKWQVGFGQIGSFEHALVWSGTSSSAVDLHQYLTGLGTTFFNSKATGVNSKGEIVGLAHDPRGQWRAVVWSPVVPEPSTFLLAIGALVLSGNRSRHGRFVA
jgi:hypothetical protein